MLSGGITETFWYIWQIIYPLVNVYIIMENHHAIHGKIHYFYGDFPASHV